MGSYTLGEPIRISGSFSAGGVAADPGAVSVRVRRGNGVETVYTSASTPAVVKDQVGAYHVDVTADVEGVWVYRVEGTTPVPGVAEGELAVRSIY